MKSLRTSDSELDEALNTFGDPEKEARWWEAPSRPLGGKSPCEIYAEGTRTEVLEELHAIRYGFPA